MPVLDHDDPALFAECVSAITLKGKPRGYLEHCLSEYDVEITVAPARSKNSHKIRPWLYLSDLEERHWAGNIKAAHLASDVLQDSAGLYHLRRIEDLTISICGHNFSENDVDTFQKAIGDLQGLRKLLLIVAENAIEQADDYFRWPFTGFSVEIQVDKPACKGKKLARKPDPQA